MEMLCIFSGLRYFREKADKLAVVLLRLPLCCPCLSALAVFGIAGCSSQQFTLAEQTKTHKEGSVLVSSSSLSSDTTASTAIPAIPRSDAERRSRPEAQSPVPPNVSRLQKPESNAPKPSGSRSILDLAAYQATTNGETAAHIRATVNGQAILDEEVREVVYPYLLATQHLPEPERTARRKEALEKELQQLIEREVILQDMFARLKDRKQVLDKLKEAAGKEFDKKMRDRQKALKIKTDEEMKAFLRAQGLSLQGIRRQIERTFMAMEWMRNRILPAIERIGHEQIREYYEGHPEEFQVQDSVTWQDIFIDAGGYPNREAARQFALKLIAKARAGEDFRQLATQYDQGNSSYLNGEGYGHRRGEIKPPEAEPILFKMPEGELGMVELTNGFHIVRLVKREFAGLKPLDDKTQTAIRNKLQAEVWEREYKRIVRHLTAKASIEISANPQ